MRHCRTITERNFATGEQVTTEVASSVPVAVARAEAIADIKAAAERRILAILPEHKQRNLIARAVEIAARHAGLSPERYPEPEHSEWRAGQVLWDRVKAMRAASGRLEAHISALSDSAAIFEFAETIENSPVWPE